jgi:transposase
MDTSLREERRNRSWPEALKREIVTASLEPVSSVSLVARRYDMNARQVFAWRKRYAAEAAEPTELRLMPVAVTPDPPADPAPTRADGLIEIEFGGYRLRVGSGVNPRAIAAVIQALNRPGGWWFLPAWLPDTEEHDIGPFRSKALALSEAERLTAEHHRQNQG